MNTRRTVIRSAVWAVPAVTIAAAAPTFAASEATCQPYGFKHPGAPNTWAYELRPDCTGGTVKSVTIDGEPTEPLNGAWWAEFTNSRSTRAVVVKFTDDSRWSGPVSFPPATGHA